MAIGPISPVARTWVPPQALRSSPSMVTIRSVPSRSEALRSPVAEAASSKLTRTGRFSVTTALATRLGLDHLGVAEGACVQVEGGALAAEVHAHGRGAEPLGDHGREQVLAGVLLHVVEAARPVDDAGDPVARQRCLEDMGDAIALVHHVQDGDAAEPAGVERLAAGGGVEGGAVEVDPAAVGVRWPRRRRRRR